MAQKDVITQVIPADAACETAPTITELCLLACTDDSGEQLELLSVGCTAVTAPVDGDDDVDVDIEFVDDSDSDSVTDLETDYDLTAITETVYNAIWQGSQILDPGDVVNAEFTITTPTTASEGLAFIVKHRVKQHSY